MSAYLLLVLFAYYILKPVSRALFIAKFDIDRLPYLYILIAVVGGVFATYYSKAASQWSLRAAVTWTTIGTIGCLIFFWWVLRLKLPWMLYVFNIWSSLFGVVTVAQGWLVASNVFDSREAKRLYGLVGLGAVIGGWTGSAFTAFMVQHLAPANLVIVCAALMAMAYGMFRITIAQKGVMIAQAKGDRGGDQSEAFTVSGMLHDIRRTRHLQVIIAIVLITFLADVVVEYQLQAAAKLEYGADDRALTSFMGGYYFWLNLASFFLQLFLTSIMVRAFGVGGTLQVMPISIGLASVAAYSFSGLWASASVRMVEASSRYSFNRAGMELLFLPLPSELRNRTKAFVDIAVDRFGRGLGGMALVALTWVGFVGPKDLPLVVIGLCLAWMALSHVAQREYSKTLRSRVERRRLDLIDARFTVSDPATLRLLEESAESAHVAPANYALSLLAESPGYDLEPLLARLSSSAPPAVRAKGFELAGKIESDVLLAAAEEQVDRADDPLATRAAARYWISRSSDAREVARRLLDHANPSVIEGAVEGLGRSHELAQELIGESWLATRAASGDPGIRRLAAFAIGVRGDQGTEILRHLLDDPNAAVAEAACEAAGKLKNRTYVPQILSRLADRRLRSAAISSLAAFGARICGTLADLLQDVSAPLSLRRQIPRVLKAIVDQRSVDTLLASIGDRELTVRLAVLRALAGLREAAPNLNYGAESVTQQILNEARYYYELDAALKPLGETAGHKAAGLLRRSLQERMTQAVDRLFHLLGLRYSPQDMFAAYRSVSRKNQEDVAAAIEFLETVLDRPLKRVVVPILEPTGALAEKGKELFGIEFRSAEQALRELIRAGDPWLVACAVAAAAEAGQSALVPEIREVRTNGGSDVSEVAGSALAALA